MALALFALLLALDPVGVEHFSTLAFWALAISVLVGELLPLEIPRLSGDGEVTVSTMFSFALLLSAGLIPAIAAQAVASAVQDGIARKPLWRIGFNIGQYALTLMAAAAAISLAIGQQPPLGSRFGPSEVFATVAGAAAFFCVNLLLVTRATSLYEGTPLAERAAHRPPVQPVGRRRAPLPGADRGHDPRLQPVALPALLHPAARRLRRRQAGRPGARRQSIRRATTASPGFRTGAGSTRRSATRSPTRMVGRAAVILVDLNRFKEVNDTLGHHHGDLRPRSRSARGCRPRFREHDLVARLGGDEFALFMRDVSRGRRRGRASTVSSAPFRRPSRPTGSASNWTRSAGIAWYPDHGSDVDTLLQRADVAMYRAKETRHSLVTYKPRGRLPQPCRLALVSDLRRTLTEGRLVLHYQPQIDVRSGLPVAVEGLVRWNHPRAGPARAGRVHRDRPADGSDQGSDLQRDQPRRCGTCSAGRTQRHDLSLSLNIPAHCLLDRSLPGRGRAPARRTTA